MSNCNFKNEVSLVTLKAPTGICDSITQRQDDFRKVGKRLKMKTDCLEARMQKIVKIVQPIADALETERQKIVKIVQPIADALNRLSKCIKNMYCSVSYTAMNANKLDRYRAPIQLELPLVY